MSAGILEIKSRRLLAEAYVREASLLECGAGTPREEQLERLQAAEQALRCALETPRHQPRSGVFAKILVATDGSPEARHAEQLAAQLAAERRARLLFVCVADSCWIGGPDEVAYTELQLPAALREKVEQYLQEAASRAPAGLLVEKLRRDGDPVTEILRAAFDWGADLIVTGSRGRGRLRGLLLGSTAQEVLHAAKCPVLVVAHAAMGTASQQPEPTHTVDGSSVRPGVSPPGRFDVLREETES
jgi:nucleotide-binding universal stress UspA family protein